MAGKNIPTAPSGPAPGTGGTKPPQSGGSGTTGTSTTTSTSSSTSSKGGGGGGGGGGVDYRKKAGNRYLDQAANLEAQAKALQYALKHSFGDALQIKLQNVNEILKGQNQVLMDGYRERVKALEGSVEDNERAVSTQTQGNLVNRLRERGNALSEIAMQGAGESDLLNAQMMALRNWEQNQAEIQRSAFDTMRSINSGLTDLNVDTKSARINMLTQAQADKEQLWTNYYNQRAETFTQLGNVRGQQADYQDMAKEYGVGKGGSTGKAKKAFMAASRELGKSYENPGIPKRLKNWQGRDEFDTPNPASSYREAPTVELGDRPEGATLRSW